VALHRHGSIITSETDLGYWHSRANPFVLPGRTFRRAAPPAPPELGGLFLSPVVGASVHAAVNRPSNGPFSWIEPKLVDRGEDLPLFRDWELMPKMSGGCIAREDSLELGSPAFRSGQTPQPVPTTPFALLHPCFNGPGNPSPIPEEVTLDLLRFTLSLHDANCIEILRADVVATLPANENAKSGFRGGRWSRFRN
jgi:hypothetical protein